jgi:LysM repeat protein
MNNPSPLIPQGATPSRGKSSLYFKVLMIVMIHVVVIGGVLLAGCERTKDISKQDTSTPSDTAGATVCPTNPVTAPVDVPPTIATGVSNAYVAGAPVQAAPPVINPVQPAATQPTVEGREYVIAKGDTLSAVAHKNGVSLKALTDANPGLNAKKLKIGQKIQLPGGVVSDVAVNSAAGQAPGATADADSAVYMVKSGDMLGRIAKTHGTTVRKIMAMNDLKSTSIHVGQKLKLPAAKTAEPSVTPAPVSTTPAPAVPAPMKVSTTMPAGPQPVAAN